MFVGNLAARFKYNAYSFTLKLKNLILIVISKKYCENLFIFSAKFLQTLKKFIKVLTCILFQYEALEEIIKPSNIRKRNFSASISSVTSETSIGNKTKDMSNNDLDESVTKDNEDLSPDDPVIADLSRGSKIRLISTAPPKQSEDRSRIWIKRTTAVPPQRSPDIEKRGRVRLRSHLGNTPKVTTHRPNRKEEEKSGLNEGDGEERGAKRDRMRSFKIRYDIIYFLMLSTLTFNIFCFIADDPITRQVML